MGAPGPAAGAAAPQFLDACVLVPRVARALALGAARAGLYRPAWSPRVLDEWRHAALRDGGPAAEAEMLAAAAAMAERFPGASVAAEPAVEAGLRLPDAGDRHVLAAAVAAGADAVITFNLRDFPARSLAPFGLVPRHPDGWLWRLWSEAPGEMDAVIRAALAEAGAADPAAVQRGLKRARLPWLAKAWGRSQGVDGGRRAPGL